MPGSTALEWCTSPAVGAMVEGHNGPSAGDPLEPGAVLGIADALAQLLVALVADAQLAAQLREHQLLPLRWARKPQGLHCPCTLELSRS